MSITIKGITKHFGSFVALNDVTLDVPAGELLALLGPSGSGKTTLLRIISGLEVPDAGSILYHDEDVTAAAVRERNVGFVFQHYALFRHMTVFDNIAFALKVRGRPKAEIRDRVMGLLRLIQLEGLERSLPSQLSGGQRQRVALARALAAEPKVLLLDEPFGALNAKVRHELRQWLRRLHDEIHVTSVFVTHDQEEAFEVADRVVIMNRGRIEQVGTPAEIFEQPATPFVMDFLGNVNVFHGHVQSGRARLGTMELAYPEYTNDESRAATAFVRAHELEILRNKNGRPSLEARVTHVNVARSVVKVHIHRGRGARVAAADARFRGGESGGMMDGNGQGLATVDTAGDALDRIRTALRGLRYGTVTAVVQDGVVIRVERTEKIRLERRQ